MNADSLASRRQDGCYCEEDIEKILFDREAIERRVREMGRQITEDYRERARCQGGEGKPRLLVVSVLRGAAIFMGDLVREINLPLEMDYGRFSRRSVRSGWCAFSKIFRRRSKEGMCLWQKTCSTQV
ncbi:MAG: phosphoribosyltransferase [Slackia sp.]